MRILQGARVALEARKVRNLYVLLGIIIQGRTIFSFTPCSDILCIQSWYMLMCHICVKGLTYLSKWGGLLYSKKFEFCKRCAHGNQYGGATCGDYTLLCSSKQVMEDEDSGIQLNVELKCGTPISLGHPIQVPKVQQHRFLPNLDFFPPVKDIFEDMVIDAFNVEEPTNMLTKSGLMIEFKGGLDSINLKEN